MEDLVRVQNEYDRLVLAWLRSHVGDRALRQAALKLAGPDGGGRKPYLSTVCRLLGVQPPPRRTLHARSAVQRRAVGDRYLREIRAILTRPKVGAAGGAVAGKAVTAVTAPGAASG